VGERWPAEQKPFAAIITCADSRISPELVFDVERGGQLRVVAGVYDIANGAVSIVR
jgi:carbonic anhydrase